MRYYQGKDIYSIYGRAIARQESAVMQQLNEFSGIVLDNGNYIKNCDIFINEELIESCFHNPDLVRQSILAEASRVDVGLLDFLKDGKDYKTLKKDLRELIDLNNDAEHKPSMIKKGLRACKRIYQVIHDYEIVSAGVAVVATGAVGTGMTKLMTAGFKDISFFDGPVKGIKAFMAVGTFIMIIQFISQYIYNFVLRYTQDYDDYKEVKSEIDENLKELKKNAKDCKDEKLKRKYEKAIEKMEDKIKKIEAKRDGVTRKAAGKWIDDKTPTIAVDGTSHQVNRRKSYND